MWYALSGFALLISIVVSYWHRVEARWPGERGETNGVRYQWDVRSWREIAFELRIAIDGVSGFDFGLKPEYQFDRLFVALGISREMQVGHADFDRRVYIMSEDALLRDALAASARMRGDLVALLDECAGLGVTLWSMRCQTGRLWLRLRPVSLTTTEAAPDVAHLANVLVPHLQRIAGHLAHLRPDRFRAIRDRYARLSWTVSSLGVGLLAYGAAMFFRGFFTGPITVDRGQLFVQALILAAIVLAGLIGLTIIALGGTSRAHVILIEIAITGGIGASLAATANLRDVNIDFDDSPPLVVDLAVVGKEAVRRRRSSSYTYKLQVGDWGGRDNGTFSFTVGPEDYREAIPFRTKIRIQQRAGALGVRWIEDYTVLHVPAQPVDMPPTTPR
jgi:hypothetical protein